MLLVSQVIDHLRYLLVPPTRWRSRAPVGHVGQFADDCEDTERLRKRRMAKLNGQRELSRIACNKTAFGRYRQGEAGFEEAGVLLVTWRDDDLYLPRQ